MEEDRMPTLFEILNRFSKPPVDLWAFYVYLKEQYGGVEYLEFWLDCAAHTALCKDLARELLKARHNSTSYRSNRGSGGNGIYDGKSHSYQSISRAMASNTRVLSSSDDIEPIPSPSSSVLFDILRDDALDTSSDRQRHSHNSQNSTNEERDLFDAGAGVPVGGNRFSSLSDERAKNKRDTVSRLSEILDNMQIPQYPSAVATSPTRNTHSLRGLGFTRNNNEHSEESNSEEPLGRPNEIHDRFNGYADGDSFTDGNPLMRNPPSTPPPRVALTSYTDTSGDTNENPYIVSPGKLRDSGVTGVTVNSENGPNNGKTNIASAVSITRRAVRESALRIIGTYLTPKAPKEIELPSDNHGWSMAEDIRQAVYIPGGIENPKVFENATTYVFEALEREALPGFLVHRALSNVQPVSATIRLVGGLIALFGGFWLAFVYILLDWTPKSHRCWVILPFAFGWYLTVSALYHIDPFLAFSGLGERDGGGVIKLQESFVRKILVRRGFFVIVSVILLTAAFCVLFIFVPGHRL